MKKKIKQSAVQTGYKKGSTDGFSRGKMEGFEQGREQSQKNRARRALVIAPGVIPSLEIGVLQPLNKLKADGGFDYELRLEGDVSKELIAQFDTVIFMRNVKPECYPYLSWASELGKKTIYVIDDNFLAIDPATRLGTHYTTPERMKTFIQFMKHCDIVKVDAQYFADNVIRHYNSNVVYFPASVDFDWLQHTNKPHREDRKIVIGYEGGTKEDDFAEVVPALQKILDNYKDQVRLEFFGFVPAKLANHPNVKVLNEEPDYRTFLHELYERTWDIGIAPLRSGRFNNCKTNNKFREYAACWIPGIYSDMPAYNG